jgi:hypothetical protein
MCDEPSGMWILTGSMLGFVSWDFCQTGSPAYEKGMSQYSANMVATMLMTISLQPGSVMIRTLVDLILTAWSCPSRSCPQRCSWSCPLLSWSLQWSVSSARNIVADGSHAES